MAAMASAAFPVGLEPLELTKYGYHPSYKQIYTSEDGFMSLTVGSTTIQD
jgi:hypothetical protein